MKKIVKSLVMIISMLCIVQTVFAADSIRITLNGKDITPTGVQAEIKDGRVFVPLRFVSEKMNCTVDWNNDTKEVTINNDIVHMVGSSYAIIKSTSKAIDIGVPSYIKDGSTMVSVRMILEALGADANWDGNTKTVAIVNKEQSNLTQTDQQEIPSTTINQVTSQPPTYSPQTEIEKWAVGKYGNISKDCQFDFNSVYLGNLTMDQFREKLETAKSGEEIFKEYNPLLAKKNEMTPDDEYKKAMSFYYNRVLLPNQKYVPFWKPAMIWYRTDDVDIPNLTTLFSFYDEGADEKTYRYSYNSYTPNRACVIAKSSDCIFVSRRIIDEYLVEKGLKMELHYIDNNTAEGFCVYDINYTPSKVMEMMGYQEALPKLIQNIIYVDGITLYNFELIQKAVNDLHILP